MTIKAEVLKMLKEDCEFKTEKSFNKYLMDYNAYDDEHIIIKIFEVFTGYKHNLGYDFISRECSCYGQVSYYSLRIGKTIMLTMDDSFAYETLDEILEAIKSYETEVAEVEYNMKHK